MCIEIRRAKGICATLLWSYRHVAMVAELCKLSAQTLGLLSRVSQVGSLECTMAQSVETQQTCDVVWTH